MTGSAGAVAAVLAAVPMHTNDTAGAGRIAAAFAPRCLV